MTTRGAPAHPLHVIDHIRSPLFVPATRPERFSKAAESGADAVIIDLEDAVAAAEKERARDQIRQHLPQWAHRRCPVGVRTNSAATEELIRDAAVVAEVGEHLDFLVLPEVQGVEDLQHLQGQLIAASLEPSAITDLPVIALIESSRGLLNAPAIAEDYYVRRLALGAADLAEEWEVEPSSDEAEFTLARQQLVLASRAAGLDGPLDSPQMNVADAAGLSDRVGAIVSLGMKGKLCIHPSQVTTVRSSFVISAAEYARLTELIRIFEEAESAGESSVRLGDGSFVDYPVYRRGVKQVEEYLRSAGSSSASGER